MTTSAARPLLTFAVISCNQEAFVKEAVEAAFAQTYSPLEIVLSDVCSDDRSFEIMREMAANYRGPHTIVLNRMDVRKAIGGHLNRVLEISRGELIFCAAADDVSLPTRAEVTFRAWESSGRRATSLHSDYIQIDATGRCISQILERDQVTDSARFQKQPVQPLSFVQTLQPVVFGCTHAFSRSLYGIFGNLLEEVTHEDDVLAFRSVLAGELFYINEPLVKYRVHDSNVYLNSRNRAVNLKGLEREEDRLKNGFRNREIMYRAFLVDLKKAFEKKLLAGEDYERLTVELELLRARNELLYKFFESSLWTKWRIFRRLKRQAISEKESSILVRRLLPRAVFLRVRLARSRSAAAWGRWRSGLKKPAVIGCNV